MFKNQIGGFKNEFGSRMAVLNDVKIMDGNSPGESTTEEVN